ncbi:MAG: hypothetical protein ACFFCQ_05410 [Promethearchaeota archaeon]
MSEKPKYVKYLTWIDGDFQETPAADSSKITLTIDENSESLILSVPAGTGLIIRRTVDRRVNSIIKSGFEFPDLIVRLGAGFELIKQDTGAQLSEALLMAGHKYGGSTSQRPEGIVKLASEEEVILPESAPEVTVTTPTVSVIQPVEPPAPVQPAEIPAPVQPAEIPAPVQPAEIPAPVQPSMEISTSSSPTDETLTREYFAAGLFISAFLQQTTDLFISRKENTVTVEFDRGVVSFELKKDHLENFSTQRVPLDDELVKRAKNVVENFLSKLT